MKVKILKVSTNELAEALIRSGKSSEMPSIQENWRYNFNKHIKLPNSSAYVLVTEETPAIIEGCLIFQLKENEIPYMAYVEIAPHNKDDEKKYDYVGGCLIAYAFKLSLMRGKGYYKGMLFFDVQESNDKDQMKLMGVYSKRYNAKILEKGGTTMVIMDEGGNDLIKRFLNRQ